MWQYSTQAESHNDKWCVLHVETYFMSLIKKWTELPNQHLSQHFILANFLVDSIIYNTRNCWE